MNTEMTINEFVAQHTALEKQLVGIDMQNASPSDFDLLKQAAEDKQFLTQAEKGLELCTGGTLPLSYPDGRDNVESILKKDDYIRLLGTLTGGQNESFIELLTSLNPTKAAEIKQNLVDVMEFKEIQEAVGSQSKEYTVGDVMQAASKADDIIQIRQLDAENVYESARTQAFLLHNSGRNDLMTMDDAVREKSEVTLIQLAKKLHDGDWKAADKDEIAEAFHLNEKDVAKVVEVLEQIERDEPVEVIESNDGYVLNTSKQTAAAMNQIEEKLEANSPNEVKQPVVKETTSDPAAVGGKVKLEAADDRGTREKQAGLDL